MIILKKIYKLKEGSEKVNIIIMIQIKIKECNLYNLTK